MTIKPIQSIATLALVALLLSIAGCADKANPDNVDTRSVERWNYLIEHQAEKAYDYLTPGYRATQPRDTYAAAMNSRPLKWTDAKFVSKECDAERCSVKVNIGYDMKVPGAGKVSHTASVQSETWILINGEWYFLPSV